jgi:sulfatase maturation enzyme AslB (radical SAM superfamily)
LSFTGGEPLLHFDKLIEYIKFADGQGISSIRTGTNGFIFQGSDKPGFRKKIEKYAKELAKTKIYTFWISIDSADAKIHEKMRGLPGVIEGIRKGLPIFHKHGIYPAANLGINRNVGGYFKELYTDQKKMDMDRFYEIFEDSFKRFYDFVLYLGFTTANACYPMSVDENDGSLESVYTATSQDKVIKFTKKEKKLIFKALFKTIPKYRHRLRIFTPRISLYSLISQYSDDNYGNAVKFRSYPCRGGIDFFFIDAVNGDTFPCGYRGGDNFGKFWELDWKKIPNKAHCTECDWECFRDPSELFGPILSSRQNPIRAMKRLYKNKKYLDIWKTDLGYYKACNWFDARLKPDYEKLDKFKLS